MWFLLTFCLIRYVLGSSITNGTCYYKAHAEADSIYAPCGNTIDRQVWPCCQLGDKFNNYNTCTWKGPNGVIYTYVAGCTDPNYEHDSCPNKGNYSDNQWVGLAWKGCTVEGDGYVGWDGCPNDGFPEVRVSNESADCTCDDENVPLILAPTGLVAEGYLPTSKMQQITWIAGYTRTDPTAVATAAAITSGSTRTLVTPSTRGSSSTASSSSSNTDTPASSTNAPASTTTTSAASKPVDGTWIAVGLVLGLGGFAAACMGAPWLYTRIRRKNKKVEASSEKPRAAAKTSKTSKAKKTRDEEKGTPTIPTISDTANAEPAQHESAVISLHSELPGSPADPSLLSTTASPNSIHPQRKNEYDVYYRPYQYQESGAGMTSASQSPEPSRSQAGYAEYQPYRPQHELDNGGPRGVNDALTGGGTISGNSPGRNVNVHELPGCSPDEASS